MGEDGIGLMGFWLLENIHTNPDETLDISSLNLSSLEGPFIQAAAIGRLGWKLVIRSLEIKVFIQLAKSLSHLSLPVLLKITNQALWCLKHLNKNNNDITSTILYLHQKTSVFLYYIAVIMTWFCTLSIVLQYVELFLYFQKSFLKLFLLFEWFRGSVG